MQERIYQTCIHNTDELKQRLIQFWYNLDEISINTAIDQRCKRLSVNSCEGRSFRAHHVNSLTVKNAYDSFCVTACSNINYCVRGGHKPARWPWPTSRLTEMEK